nr:hypothetical protein GCM10020185_74480 [Pseudomonas brassicacearum subsp. brassicacearum]
MAGTMAALLSRICPAPAVMTPGKVQPGIGIGRSKAPRGNQQMAPLQDFGTPLEQVVHLTLRRHLPDGCVGQIAGTALQKKSAANFAPAT